MNIVPREFQGQKPEGPQALRVFGLGTSQGNPALVTGILLQHIFPLGSIDSVNPSILGRDLEKMTWTNKKTSQSGTLPRQALALWLQIKSDDVK